MPKRGYPWGDEADAELANYVESKIETTSAVGSFQAGASPYGVEELSGNVWEWLLERQGDLVGGAFYSEKSKAFVSSRSRDQPDDGFNSIGFRCVVVPISHP